MMRLLANTYRVATFGLYVAFSKMGGLEIFENLLSSWPYLSL